MAGRHSFAELRAKMSPEARARAEEKAMALGREMDLAELRRALRLSQEELAQTLQVGQAAVAKLEKRADMYVCEHAAPFHRSHGRRTSDRRALPGSRGADPHVP